MAEPATVRVTVSEIFSPAAGSVDSTVPSFSPWGAFALTTSTFTLPGSLALAWSAVRPTRSGIVVVAVLDAPAEAVADVLALASADAEGVSEGGASDVGAGPAEGPSATGRFLGRYRAPMTTPAATRATARMRTSATSGARLRFFFPFFLPFPSSDFAPIMSKKQFDLVMSSFVSTDPYGVAYFRQTYASDSTLNKSGTGSKEFDAKIAEMEKIADPKKQIAKANELEAEALKFYGVMPVYNGATKRAVKEKVANYGAMGFVKLPIQNIGFVK